MRNMSRAYDALVLDIDGTLLDEAEQLAERTLRAIARARAAGVVVMLATGRSHAGTRDIARRLDLDTPCVVFNGAALYDPRQDRLVDAYWLPRAFVSELLDFAHARDLLPVVSRPEAQLVRTPRAHETQLISGFRDLHAVAHEALPRTEALRVTLFSQAHADSASFHAQVTEAMCRHEAYYTHFALAALAGFRESAAQVVDVQPVCRGKAEALRVLAQQHAIAPERVVAVGDAGNDVPILQAAGLGVAMGNATPETKLAARRVIGDNQGSALAELIEELFS